MLSLQGSEYFQQDGKGDEIHPASTALFHALKKDLSNCSEDFEGPRERDLKNYDTGAFNIKAILESKPADSERFEDPLSSCCCEVEDDESNVSISQML